MQKKDLNPEGYCRNNNGAAVNGRSAAKAGGPNGHQHPEAAPHSEKKFYPLNWSADDWNLNPYEARVLFHILRRASSEGLAWSAERTMALHLGLDRKTIRKQIRALEQKCVLATESCKFPGRRQQNVYVVRHPADWREVYKPGSEGEKYWLETRANCDRKMFRRQPETEIGPSNFAPDVGGPDHP